MSNTSICKPLLKVARSSRPSNSLDSQPRAFLHVCIKSRPIGLRVNWLIDKIYCGVGPSKIHVDYSTCPIVFQSSLIDYVTELAFTSLHRCRRDYGYGWKVLRSTDKCYGARRGYHNQYTGYYSTGLQETD